MKTKTIVLALAGLGLATVLMAHEPQGSENGERGGYGMHQRGMDRPGMHRGGFRDSRLMRHGHRRGFMRRMGRELNLTSEQRRQFRELFKAERKAREAERRVQRRHGKKRGSMFGSLNPETFMSADHFDKDAYVKAVEKQAQQRRTERRDRRRSRLEHRAAFMEKIFNILTPEQRVKWIELAKEK